MNTIEEGNATSMESNQSSRVSPTRIAISIPDMFESFMAVKPISNPNYEQVKAEADAWILE